MAKKRLINTSEFPQQREKTPLENNEKSSEESSNALSSKKLNGDKPDHFQLFLSIKKLLNTKKRRTVALGLAVCVSIGLIALFSYQSKEIAYNKKVNEPVMTIGTVNVSQAEYDAYFRITANAAFRYYADRAGDSKTLNQLNMNSISDSNFMNSKSPDGKSSWKSFLSHETNKVLYEKTLLQNQANLNRFKYNDINEWSIFQTNISKKATAENLSVADYLKKYYGPYASFDVLKDIIHNFQYVNTYSSYKFDQFLPADNTINDYYQKNKNEYDVVDYGDFVAKDEDSAKTAFGQIFDMNSFVEQAKQYSSKSQTEKMKQSNSSYILYSQSKDNIPTAIQDWLFSSGVQANTSAIIKDVDKNEFHVTFFLKRYQDTTPTVTYCSKVFPTTNCSVNSQTVGTEQNKVKSLIKQKGNVGNALTTYNNTSAGAFYLHKNSLYKAGATFGYSESTASWLSDPDRHTGDVSISSSDQGSTIIVFCSAGLPRWKVNVKRMASNKRYKDFIKGASNGTKIKFLNNTLSDSNLLDIYTNPVSNILTFGNLF